MTSNNHLGTVISPLTVPISSKRNFSLNLNTYRNTYFHTLNAAKVKYGEIVRDQIKDLNLTPQIAIQYTLFPGSRRRMDLMNVISVTSKFFLDLLVKEGKLTDDSYNYVISETTAFGCLCKEKPHVRIDIYEAHSDSRNL